MKNLRTYKLFESTVDTDLEDILLELQDDGYRIMSEHNDNFNIIGIRPYVGFTKYSKWSFIKDYALRIKDYLGPKYIKFKYKSPYHSDYETIILSEVFESTIESDLEDICLELTDDGLHIDMGEVERYKKFIMISRPYFESRPDRKNIEWSELKEYALRIKDYLDNRFVKFIYQSMGGLRDHVTVNLDEDTEIHVPINMIAIIYNEKP